MERNLTIGVDVVGVDAARAQFDSLATSTEKLAASTKAEIAGMQGVADAVLNLKMAEDTIAKGGVEAHAAIQKLPVLVEELNSAVFKFQSGGGVVRPDHLALLEQYTADMARSGVVITDLAAQAAASAQAQKAALENVATSATALQGQLKAAEVEIAMGGAEAKTALTNMLPTLTDLRTSMADLKAQGMYPMPDQLAVISEASSLMRRFGIDTSSTIPQVEGASAALKTMGSVATDTAVQVSTVGSAVKAGSAEQVAAVEAVKAAYMNLKIAIATLNQQAATPGTLIKVSELQAVVPLIDTLKAKMAEYGADASKVFAEESAFLDKVIVKLESLGVSTTAVIPPTTALGTAVEGVGASAAGTTGALEGMGTAAVDSAAKTTTAAGEEAGAMASVGTAATETTAQIEAGSTRRVSAAERAAAADREQAAVAKEASAEQVAALEAVKTAQAGLNTAWVAMLNTTKDLGKIGATELQTLVIPLESLKLKVAELQAMGPIGAKLVPPNAAATIAQFELLLAGLGAAGTGAGKGIDKAKESTKLFNAEAAFARGNIGGLARGIAALGGTFASIALPILLIPSALMIVERMFSAFGVSMDDLKVAFGGLGKVVEEGAKGLEEYQRKLTDLDATQRIYKSGADLLMASNLDVASSFEAIAGVTGRWVGDVDLARKAANDLATGLGAIRIMSQSAADALTKDIVAALKAVETGVPGATQQLATLMKHERDLEKQASDFAQQLEKTYGKDAPAAYGKFTSAIIQTEAQMTKLRDAGMTESEVFATIKGNLEIVIEGFNRFGTRLASADAALAKQAATLLEYAKSHDATTMAIQKHDAAEFKAQKTYEQLEATLRKASTTQAEYNVVLVSQKSAIESMINALENKLAQDGALDDMERKRLETLRAQREQIRELTGETDKYGDSAAKAKLKVIELANEQTKLATAYANSLARIREHSQALLDASEKELRSTEAVVDAQIASLSRMHDQGEIQSQEYFRKVAELQNQEVEMRRAAQVKEDLVNKERAQSEKDLTDKFVTDSQTRIEKLRLEGASWEDAKQMAADFASANEGVVRAIVDVAKAISEGIVTRRGFEGDIKGIDTAMKGLGKAAEAQAAVLDNYTGAINARHIPSAREHAAAAGKVASALGDITAATGPASKAVGDLGTSMAGSSSAFAGTGKAAVDSAKEVESGSARSKKAVGEMADAIAEKAEKSTVSFRGVTKVIEEIPKKLEESTAEIKEANQKAADAAIVEPWVAAAEKAAAEVNAKLEESIKPKIGGIDWTAAGPPGGAKIAPDLGAVLASDLERTFEEISPVMDSFVKTMDDGLKSITDSFKSEVEPSVDSLIRKMKELGQVAEKVLGTGTGEGGFTGGGW